MAAIFKSIILNENVWIMINISLAFVVPKGPFNNIHLLVQILSWRRPGNKPSSEPMMVSLQAHICVNRPQWVNVGFGAGMNKLSIICRDRIWDIMAPMWRHSDDCLYQYWVITMGFCDIYSRASSQDMLKLSMIYMFLKIIHLIYHP